MPFVYTAKLMPEEKHVSVASQSSSFREVHLELKKLEDYSLRSSEEINDSIEQLIECIENNAAALNKAIKDMTLMPTTYPNYSSLSAD